MRFNLIATALACCAAFASIGAQASTPEAFFNGSYVIEVLPSTTQAHPNPSCLIFDGEVVRTHRWPFDGLCGLGIPHTYPDIEWEVTWDIAPVKHTDGRKAYVVRNRLDGQCLIRGNNGHDLTPHLHMWSDTNPQWCGWSSQDALIDNGQAAWVFGDSPVEGENRVASMAVMRHGSAYLSFASNDTNLREGQAIVAVDSAFRLTRVAEHCSTPHALLPDVVRVCGLGDFAAPVRAEDRAYLQMGMELWAPGPGMGDVSQAYVAMKVDDAALYCGRLRTGGFADWRVPAGAELAGLLDAFPNNKLFTQFGWPTGDLPFQTTDLVAGDVLGVTLHNRGFERLSEHGNYPVVCIR